jgi:hypothetical protein
VHGSQESKVQASSSQQETSVSEHPTSGSQEEVEQAESDTQITGLE